jgi:hypothetical protein
MNLLYALLAFRAYGGRDPDRLIAVLMRIYMRRIAHLIREQVVIIAQSELYEAPGHWADIRGDFSHMEHSVLL